MTTTTITQQAQARLVDMTVEDVLVLSDLAKDWGLGLTPPDPRAAVPLAYLAYVPPQLEEAFARVFPHLPARVRGFNWYPGRYTYLFEEAALLAVLVAFGLAPRQLKRHIHRWWCGSTYVVVRKRARRPA
jgi:hypothetical protein